MKTYLNIVLIIFFMFVGPVYATDFCQNHLIDEAGMLSPAEFKQVQNAIDELKKDGIEARIILVDNQYDQPTLNGFKTNFQCPSWRAQDGGMKNNLVVFIVNTSSQSLGIYYGDGLKKMILPHERTIRNNMNAKYRDGDYLGFLKSGISDLKSLAQIDVSHDGKAVTVNQPTDLSGLWKIFSWIITFIVIASILA